MFPKAFDNDNFEQILESNDSTPNWLLEGDVLNRIIEYARQRAEARGQDSALENGDADCLIVTNWSSFTDDWGYTEEGANQVSIGTFNHSVSSGKDAGLFNETQIIQRDWLETGDGRKTQAEYYIDESYDGANEGEMWIPNNAQDYICIVELSGELLHGEPSAAEAM